MADVCPSSGEYTEDCGEERIQQNKDLERMIEDMENISVHLTWLAYDMVVQRTSPELSDSLKKFEEEYLRCKAAICDSIGQDQGACLRDVEQCQLQEPGFDIAMEECPKTVDHTATSPPATDVPSTD
ncbi:synaptonemal complex central element protein 3 [Osmerus eperlanus]|uniref:synaptonemal complex central element protein 3 n=1 Tax=Osmerus eperlanus TaxID=29151 RepID=UPI002E159AB9